MAKFSFSKRVDKSTVTTGISVPVGTHIALYEVLGGEIPKGTAADVQLLIDGEYFHARMNHLNFSEKYAHREMVNLYWGDAKCKEKMMSLFQNSHEYFAVYTDVNQSPNNHITISSTDQKGVFLVEYQLDHNFVLQKSKDLQYYISKIKNINRSTLAGQKAPHKPVLLLAIGQLVRDGIIIDNFIRLNDTLKREFNRVWEENCKDVVSFKPTINTPFERLQSDGFWIFDATKGTAFMDQELIDLFSHNESYSALEETLLNEIYTGLHPDAVKPNNPTMKTTEQNPAIYLPRQIIFYGAPGTGKSNRIDRLTNKDNRIRTTFHPDSDYSTFVGAYKPTMDRRLLRDLSGHRIKDEKTGNEIWDSFISYRFVPQAFLEAYVEAWKRWDRGDRSPFYLIIEEINRGNCAQIFGDLFQLLDRGKSGASRYNITPDNDIREYLAYTAFRDCNHEIPPSIKSGEIMALPSNLYIWATMNTSDQSLFPIDSAFKRRWDWKYIPIAEGTDQKTGSKLNWKIDIDGMRYDWWEFLQKINAKIEETTSSEDKKLGYFFAKAENGIIDVETLVSKVFFYLWNDVFKDYGFADELFKDGENGCLTFAKLFLPNGDANREKAALFLSNLKVDAEIEAE